MPVYGTLTGRSWSVDNRCDCFDLHELVPVAQNRDSHERTWNALVPECVTNYVPDRHQVGLVGGGNEDACADHVFQARAGCFQGNVHVLDRFGGLGRVVADSGGRSVLVQGAGLRQEDEACIAGAVAA